MEHPAQNALVNQLLGKYGAFHMDALAKIDGVFAPGALDRRLYRLQLGKGGHPRLVGKIVLSGRQDPQANFRPVTGDGRRGHQTNLRI